MDLSLSSLLGRLLRGKPVKLGRLPPAHVGVCPSLVLSIASLLGRLPPGKPVKLGRLAPEGLPPDRLWRLPKGLPHRCLVVEVRDRIRELGTANMLLDIVRSLGLS